MMKIDRDHPPGPRHVENLPHAMGERGRFSARSYDSSSPPEPAEKNGYRDSGWAQITVLKIVHWATYELPPTSGSCGKIARRSFRMTPRRSAEVRALVRFLTWLKRFFWTAGVGLTLRVASYDSHDTEHAVLEFGRRFLWNFAGSYFCIALMWRHKETAQWPPGAPPPLRE